MSYFNIRVYGIWIDAENKVLLSDERACGVSFTKFPGGGLELGEGLRDALKREFREECQLEIEVLEHLYTTDFYEQSSFNGSQIISIYYLVRPLNEFVIPIKSSVFEFEENSEQSFRKIPLALLSPEDVTFATDKEAIRVLQRSAITK